MRAVYITDDAECGLTGYVSSTSHSFSKETAKCVNGQRTFLREADNFLTDYIMKCEIQESASACQLSGVQRAIV
jgi:hypothetical protein